ncbi:MAG: thiol reductant ABC exporter subunit CydD [Devosia sp.]|uniref:thiol reductant ABC exporter subunit CydD n=2 Tax=Devosia sp. TaxID=1871048 RepID=UPI001AC11857|nr:thiol reductant ABC exporter subunit CydD [Devosia sp.]MBN9315725.1 thiol reductant ABC exporter subunit CydD [Devosia sp.]
MIDKPKNVAPGRWLNRLAAADRRLLAVSLGLPLLSGALVLAQAFVLAGVLGAAIVEHVELQALWGSIGLIGLLIALRVGLAVFGEVAAVRLSEAIKLDLRRTMFADLMAARTAETSSRSSGALASTVIEQVEALDGYFVRYLPAMLQAAILPLAFAIAVFPIDWVVGLLFLFTAPLIPVFMALAGWGAEAASRRQASALNRLGGHFADRLRGLTTLQLFGEAERETERVRVASEELRVRTMRVMRIAFLSSAVLEFFAALGVAGVALYVGLTFLDLVTLRGTELTLAAGMFCLLMAPEVYNPLRLLAAHYHDRAAALAAVAEMDSRLERLPGVAPAVAPAPARPAEACAAARLELRDVSAATPDGHPVLSGIDLAVAPGRHIAILGESGRGKSTLLEAIAGLRPFGGAIALDGVPLAAVPESGLRSYVAVLGQRPHIFAGSIADNIRLGRREADDAAVRQAAHLARVADFADRLPAGLATRIGEDGLGLSGGELQRVALARLYLRDPGLLLLDEPTAHLDSRTEAAVLDGLIAFARGRTMVVVTHSLAVAARMDGAFCILGGRLSVLDEPGLANGKAGIA